MGALANTAMNTLFWEAGVMTLIIGFVNIGIGGNKINPKDFGIVILSGALMETLALSFVIEDRAVFDATVAAAFVLLLWMISIALILGGTNLYVIQHALWFTGILFFGFATYTAYLHLIFITIILYLLVPVTVFLSLHGYTGKAVYAKIAGYCSAIDGFLFLVLAFTGAIGVVLP
ncbi:hypothetical protein Calag_0842 [Caldisphaera lagunensis DSM 15908]|uniref:Uncharacterized protein n=1 Tax=Caldisphaera lagunensis (strain DSM 15908 / JCM 11604 / ANMR 0165 / IC-154) TaxID=1056495 RepID=L0A9K8_CALLD|nr:hypothetical protein [Caldisphaera lagunensis]AFZ70583.1 hypothetical protein Calag_0842 [Caldisphaera lagunensis DSM 15908]